MKKQIPNNMGTCSLIQPNESFDFGTDSPNKVGDKVIQSLVILMVIQLENFIISFFTVVVRYNLVSYNPQKQYLITFIFGKTAVL